MSKKRFLCIFPLGTNIHLIKDVGMIPYVLQSEGYYDSTVAFYEDERNLPYLKQEVKGLNYKQVRKIFKNEDLNILWFLLTNLNQYDVIMFFHGGNRKLITALLIKALRFGKTDFYIKLDANKEITKYNFKSTHLKFYLLKYLYKYIKLISVETKYLQEYLNENSYYKTQYIPNGYLNRMESKVQKENIILTVARIGDPIKDNNTLLKALSKVNLGDWKVKLVGPIQDSFLPIIEEFYKINPKLVGKVIFTGNISNRQKLANEYSLAKVFVLTSISEGFPLVFTEAISNGCYIVSTDLIAAYDITNNGEYGKIVPIGDDYSLAKEIQAIIDGKSLPEANEIKSYAEEFYNWKVIARNIHSCLEFKN